MSRNNCDTITLETLNDLAKSRHLSDHQFQRCFCIIVCHAELSDTVLSQLWPQFKTRLLNSTGSKSDKYRELELLIKLEKMSRFMKPEATSSIAFRLGISNQFNIEPQLQYKDNIKLPSSEMASLRDKLSLGLSQLTQNQKSAYKILIKAIESRDGNSRDGFLFYLGGSAGTGKTFLLNLIITRVKLRKKLIVAVASSGLAATNLLAGQSANSMFQLDSLTPNDKNCELLLKKCQVIVWDECSMIDIDETLMPLDRRLRHLRKSPKTPMGGVIMIFAGDFRKTMAYDGFEASLKNWKFWPKVRQVDLGEEKAFRFIWSQSESSLDEQHSIDVFEEHLLNIGEGTFPFEPADTNIINIPDDFCVFIKNQRDLVRAIYQETHWTRRKSLEWLSQRVILAPTNRLVNQHHQIIERQIWRRQKSKYYKSIDRECSSEQNGVTKQVLNSLLPRAFPPHLLALQVGVPIMLLRQLDAQKLTTGTRLRVDSLHKNYIVATILTGLSQGERVHIPRVLIRQDQDEQYSRRRHASNAAKQRGSRNAHANIRLERFQFPVQLAYSMTINKGQYLAQLRHVGLDLSTTCFAHGQLYGAMSRASQATNLFVLSTNRSLQRTRNIIDFRALH